MSRRNLLIILVAAAVVAVLFTYGVVETWNLVLLQPMLNLMILLSGVLFHSLGLAIIALTIIVRLLMFPLTMKQLHSTRAMTSLQPKMQEIQKKYAKDRQQLQQEMSRLYKEAGVNPLGCLWPMLIQLPIWIALYQSILRAVAATPEDLLGLSQRLYSLPILHQTVPLESGFLWLNLGSPDSFYILAILVGGTMWLQQKMMTMPATDPRQQSMSRMMLWMMPLMFAFFTLQFPSGLALFWVISNVIGIVMQYFVTGWGGLEGTLQRWRGVITRAPAAATPVVSEQGMETIEGARQEEKIAIEAEKQEKRVEYGKRGGKRKERRRGSRARSKKTRRKS
ncbi:MAG: YidC/Oxa1 family membrane protein insertase [Dehalococcoidia bacterium]